MSQQQEEHHCKGTQCFHFIMTSKGNICEEEAHDDKEKCEKKRYLMWE